jgi:ATP-dependent RNA helicase RhlE
VEFEELRLRPALLAAVQHEGYREPTPIQAQAIPHILEGRDLLGCAQAGTGKTAAFALPILHRIAAEARRDRPPRALVLVPTRELAGQVAERFTAYGRRVGARCAAAFGGVGQEAQVAALRDGLDVLVATPESLLDLYDQHLVELHSVGVLVLDEADRMLDMGFIKPIRRVVAAVPSRRQTVMFSATMPAAIRGLAGSLLRNPAQVSVAPSVPATPLVEQQVYYVKQAEKIDLLADVLSRPEAKRVIVFTRTKHGADKVARKLARSDIEAAVIHGNQSQHARLQALSHFKNGRVRVLVATDVAARGLDVEGISHVVNYDVPSEPERYVHRIGRAGAAGLALSFCADGERTLVRDIEKLTREPMTVLRGKTMARHLVG